MKRIGNLYDEISSPENIRAAILKASRGKRNRVQVRAVLNNLDFYTMELARALQTETVELHPYTHDIRVEGSRQKRREIHKPRFWPDQCVHWAIYNVLGTHIYKGFYSVTCGSVPGRGVHYGKRFVEKWIRTDRKNTKYYLKMDVHHFYPSVPNEKLKEALRRKFKDKRLLALLDRVIDMDQGLSIGVLLSQPLANFYLTPLDFYIKQELGAAHYIRYMDDMVVFGRNKKALHKMRVKIAAWLEDHGLEMKANWQICKEDTEPLDFMGFRFYRNRTTLRRSIMLRITRRVRRVDRKGKWATPHDAAAVLSYMGWIYASDTHQMFLVWIKPHLHIQRMKSIVRRAQNEKVFKHKYRKTPGVGHC